MAAPKKIPLIYNGYGVTRGLLPAYWGLSWSRKLVFSEKNSHRKISYMGIRKINCGPPIATHHKQINTNHGTPPPGIEGDARCDLEELIYSRSIKVFVSSSTFLRGMQNQCWNSSQWLLLESLCVISRESPQSVKYLYQHDFLTLLIRNMQFIWCFFWRLHRLR